MASQQTTRVLASLTCLCLAGTEPLAARDLTIESLLDIRHPSAPAFSPDGRFVAFVWDRAGVQNVWAVETKGGAPRALTRFDDGLVGPPFFSRDGGRVYFEREGDLWQASIAGTGPAEATWKTPEGESGFALSPDGSSVAFSRDGDIFVRSLADGRERRLTSTPEADGDPAFSPDGTRVAYGIARGTPRQEAPAYSGPKLLFSRFEFASSSVGIARIADGSNVFVKAPGGNLSAHRWLDANRLTVESLSSDVRTREVLVVEAASGETRSLHSEIDEKFWSLGYLGADAVPSPDGRLVAFVSDRDGWDQLYVVSPTGGPAIPVSKGPQEVADFRWSPDSKKIVYGTNAGDQPGRRQIAIVDLSSGPGRAKTTVLTRGAGARSYPAWSPDGRSVLFQATDPRNSADLYVMPATGGETRRLTDSMPHVDRSALVAPEFVRYRSADGASVPAYLFVPKSLDRAKKNPAIVWVHGDGITQNYEGWHVRRDYAVYYSLHQYLAQKGYVVLAVDYRGSIGYGRKWRQGHYRDLGGKDYEDIAAGAGYLKSLDYVDANRIGIWGLSYGGFMALQALTVTPKLFACAIDVAGVHDWEYWYNDPGGPWIQARMGNPKDDPENYKRLSPVHHLDKIERPLLVLHGTADVNVPFLESVHLIDELLKKGKDVEFAMYPGEFHYFQRAHVLRDAWTRVEAFFDKHLRKHR